MQEPAAAKPRRLLCCCCAGVTLGRQFWNQDTGHGLGACCVAFVSRKMTPAEVARTYGLRGVHYDIPAPGKQES